MKKNVLVVDDDASVRKSLCKVLSGTGYNVLEAKNGPEAVELFETRQIDLVLLDIGLPIENGWDVFEHITSQAPILPIIIITGTANQHDTAIAAGVGALMEKPLDVPRLLKTMQELLVESKEARLSRLCGYSQNTRYLASRPAGDEQVRRE
jgi:two-component system autoinducer 1 sensor kinase/phosphatase LuxN